MLGLVGMVGQDGVVEVDGVVRAVRVQIRKCHLKEMTK